MKYIKPKLKGSLLLLTMFAVVFASVNNVSGIQMKAYEVKWETCTNPLDLVPFYGDQDGCDLMKIRVQFVYYIELGGQWSWKTIWDPGSIAKDFDNDNNIYGITIEIWYYDVGNQNGGNHWQDDIWVRAGYMSIDPDPLPQNYKVSYALDTENGDVTFSIKWYWETINPCPSRCLDP